jgi:hypothetical protein
VKEGLGASDVGAALKGAVVASATPEVDVDVAVDVELSSPEVPVDFGAIVSEASEGSSNSHLPQTATSSPDVTTAQPALVSSLPLRPSINRRMMLFGAAGVVAVIGLLAIGLHSRGPAPTRIAASTRASSQSASKIEAAPTASLAANSPPASAAAVATQAGATSDPQAAASATAAAEDEEAKIAVNVKPDGSQFLYKGRVVGRTPFILKQPRGEKRAYEVGKVGYATRRVYVTGTERSISFELGLDTPHPDSL